MHNPFNEDHAVLKTYLLLVIIVEPVENLRQLGCSPKILSSEKISHVAQVSKNDFFSGRLMKDVF